MIWLKLHKMIQSCLYFFILLFFFSLCSLVVRGCHICNYYTEYINVTVRTMEAHSYEYTCIVGLFILPNG